MYHKILVPLDGSELAECVLPHVETIAKGCHTTTVTFIRVAEPAIIPVADGEYFSPEIWAEMKSQAIASTQNYLRKLFDRIQSQYEGIDVETKIISGRVADSIVEYANKNDIDLIIIATHGRSGISRWIRGSVAERILHSSRMPVLMIQAQGNEQPV